MEILKETSCRSGPKWKSLNYSINLLVRVKKYCAKRMDADCAVCVHTATRFRTCDSSPAGRQNLAIKEREDLCVYSANVSNRVTL